MLFRNMKVNTRKEILKNWKCFCLGSGTRGLEGVAKKIAVFQNKPFGTDIWNHVQILIGSKISIIQNVIWTYSCTGERTSVKYTTMIQNNTEILFYIIIKNFIYKAS